MSKKLFNEADAKRLGEQFGLKWEKFEPDQLAYGMNVELEHGTEDAVTNVTNDDEVVTFKIALAHLNEFPDYYVRLKKMEKEAEAFWGIED
ncbi:MAG: hypothetical protein PHO15_10795 [Eubacteriales bacterium]|nr:hypothetical protein [Eubacteriales bacterium]